MIPAGSYRLGPEQATLTVRTGRGGAAAKAGHNLLIEVTSWSATLEVADDSAQSSLTLSADSRSLKVRDGTGGIQALGEDDKVGITKTIHQDVLKGSVIAFRSSTVTPSPDGGPVAVSGQLELFGRSAPMSFELEVDDGGSIAGTATLKQSDWGVKPYSALFGTLKVLDEVVVAVDGTLPAAG
jgi:polyisoprenoid-binding protein YceI